MSEEVILRFSNIDFEYEYKKPILDEANFSIRHGAKITLMGQNGAGKSTIFNLIKGNLKPKTGNISIAKDTTIGAALQVIVREDYDLSIVDYFARAFYKTPGNLKSQISKVFTVVNLIVPFDRHVGALSGGQQARLLLAYALIQNPDILLLDEPTNNLDQAGINHLVDFLIAYNKTVIVISHDADFLNCFTEGVLYLDIFTKKLEIYVGDYYTVIEEIANRIEREKRKNAQLEKKIIDRKEKVNFFANKGGKMRKLAKKMKDETAKLSESKVSVRHEDKTIRSFTIPTQDIYGDIVTISSVKVIINHEPVIKKKNKILKRGDRLLISGPNGIGKSTLLRSLVNHTTVGTSIMDGVQVGYYSQNFSTLNFKETVFDSLKDATKINTNSQEIRSVAAGFLLTGDLLGQQVGHLSEGQKGLLSFARLVLRQPGLLVLDEPTNHINFRHISIIAKAIDNYKGSIILISHMPEFIEQIHIDDYLDLEKV